MKLPTLTVKNKSHVFSLIRNLTGCHSAIPPHPYYEACVVDGCSAQRQKAECQSLETYAALCGFHGICVDWRSKTNGQCGELGKTLLEWKLFYSIPLSV